jgi:hypothetical protein
LPSGANLLRASRQKVKPHTLRRGAKSAAPNSHRSARAGKVGLRLFRVGIMIPRMGTFIDVVDAIVLLLLVISLPRIVWRGSGSVLLSICIVLAVIVFALIGCATTIGLIGNEPSLMQVVVLAAFLAMAVFIRKSVSEQV